MRKAFNSLWIAIAALAIGLSPVSAQDNQLEKHIEAVNDAAKKQGMMKVALERTATETGVSLEQVQALHKRYSDVRAGGILVACVLAAETKKTPEYFMDKRTSGKGWVALAKEHNVPQEKIIQRLQRVEQALTPQGEPKTKTK